MNLLLPVARYEQIVLSVTYDSHKQLETDNAAAPSATDGERRHDPEYRRARRSRRAAGRAFRRGHGACAS